MIIRKCNAEYILTRRLFLLGKEAALVPTPNFNKPANNSPPSGFAKQSQ